jgi:predicted secreted protein
MSEITSIELQNGQRQTLRLQGRGTVGYSWTFELSDPNVVRVTIEPAPAYELTGKPQGTSLDELVMIEGVRVGRATIRLALRRAWERTGKTLDERTVEVSVVP